MNVHLICNAHLDPAWLWEMDEGAAEALATFRLAADLCERCEGFIFNHNEALLYQWVEEYDSILFSRIQTLVGEGKWHIMGGWFIQPDCNMPSGESIIRQIEEGRRYFLSRFGVEPTTAINFDPFGHSRGLVQILSGCGYDSYIITRPSQSFMHMPDDFVQWIGYDGSEVTMVRRSGYNSQFGQAVKHIEEHIEQENGRPVLPVLWGVGNHGGGPSRIDLDQISAIQLDEESGRTILHSTPERFFSDLWNNLEKTELPRWEHDLNPWAPGCYTSQIRIKQKHRELENLLYSIERMASYAEMLGLSGYPEQELESAGKDLMIAQFHDILPGSSIRAVEEAGLRLLSHGIEILVRLRTKLFLKLVNTVPMPLDEGIPIFAFNFQPYFAEGVFECEFQPANQNWDDTFTMYDVISSDGTKLNAQVEHEASSLNLDWRKKVVFQAKLPPMTMSGFLCYPKVLSDKPVYRVPVEKGAIHIIGESVEVVINENTGLVDRFLCGGEDLVEAGAFFITVVEDNEDSWGSEVVSFPSDIGRFSLMDTKAAAAFSGLTGNMVGAVRIIEDGPVRTVVEALFSYNRSYAVITYQVPKTGLMFDIDVQVFWLEPNCMAKLVIPVLDGQHCKALGQVMFGQEPFPEDNRETVTQKWQAVCNQVTKKGFAVLDTGVYGSDWVDGSLRISLLRSPVYSALPINSRPLTKGDRHHSRIDFGERSFSFRVAACMDDAAWVKIELEAFLFNESPYFLSCFPSCRRAGRKTDPGLEVTGDAVACTSLRKNKDKGYLVRLFNPAKKTAICHLVCRPLNVDTELKIQPFQVLTLQINAGGMVRVTNLLGL